MSDLRKWDLPAWLAREFWVSCNCDHSSPITEGGAEDVDGSGGGIAGGESLKVWERVVG